MRKSIKSIMAFALAATLAASTLAPATTAAAASKQNVITKATYDDGRTVKFSYNKKGLVTKTVATSSSKTNSSDKSVTTTTTYKYNKKNKIATATSKTVTKDTYYETDKTTHLKLGAKKGTITQTDTSVTKYTYNKKGLATESVTTTTTTMSGSTTTTSKTTGIRKDSSKDDNPEISGVGIIAGYNEYNADGTRNVEADGSLLETKANAFYYTGAVDAGVSTTTSTTTYTANGDGTYKYTESSSTVGSGAKKENVEAYYEKSWNNGVLTIVPLTKSEEKNSDGDTITVYKRPDGTNGSISFTIVQSVTVTADPTLTSSSSSSTEQTVSDKTVVTTKYTYDKKKRVKKAVATKVKTNETKETSSSSSESKSPTYVSNSADNGGTDTIEETTSVKTTTYTYDKKGRAKKVVESADGIANYKKTVSERPVKSSYSYVNYDDKGKVTNSNTTSSEYTLPSVYKTVTVTAKENGKETEATTYYPYTVKFVDNHDYWAGYGENKSGTRTVTFYSNGGIKTVEDGTKETHGRTDIRVEDSTTGSFTYKDGNYSNSTTNKITYYQFDEYNKTRGTIEEAGTYKYVTTLEDGTVFSSNEGTTSSTAAYYADNQQDKDGVDATVAITAAASGLVEGNWTKTEVVDTLIAEPSKYTTTYKYDKSGNVKSASKSGTYVSAEEEINEEFGNPIYEFKDNNKVGVKKRAVTHKMTNKESRENTIKKGTKTLTKQLTMSSDTRDRKKSTGYDFGKRVLFSIKSKKGDSKAKKQQWIIQNGKLNGEVGLY